MYKQFQDSRKIFSDTIKSSNNSYKSSTSGTTSKRSNAWARLIGRENEDNFFLDVKPVTALCDTGSQVNHISYDYC